MKKIFSVFLSLMLIFSLFACASNNNNVTESTTVATESSEEATTLEETNNEVTTTVEETTTEVNNNVTNKNFKIGMVLIGDENEAYSYAHIEGLRNAVAELGLSEADNVIFKYDIPDGQQAYDACADLAEQGCSLVISNSYGHQSYTQQVASEYPDIQFIAMTGDTAKSSGLTNFHNAFTKIYEARYLGGVAAGLKIKELLDANKITDENYDGDKNIKIGYVGAFPYAEVVSGYTSFFLGIKSIVPNVAMQVQYINSWGDMTAEYEAATALINDGCVIIGQHSDTTGAPSATEELHNAGKNCYAVGYSIDMSKVAPNSALTSPANNWKNFYKYAIDSVMNGREFDQNWAQGFETDSVKYTDLTSNCASGTAEKLEELKQQIINGELHVFDTNTFTVGGQKVEHAFATDTNGDFENDADEAIFDGYYHESYFQSAPSFSLRIDNIKELN